MNQGPVDLLTAISRIKGECVAGAAKVPGTTLERLPHSKSREVRVIDFSVSNVPIGSKRGVDNIRWKDRLCWCRCCKCTGGDCRDSKEDSGCLHVDEIEFDVSI